jgi:uncharacterized repeat protein (TIGR01451 family)
VIDAAGRAVSGFAAVLATPYVSRRRRLRDAGPPAGALALLAVCGAAAAQQANVPGSLELATVVESVAAVTQPDGTERTELVPASVTTSLRGDELIYTVSFVNVGPVVLDNVRITAPIPLEVRYVADSAFAPGSQALYSVDGGRTFGQPRELYVGVLEGSRRLAAADDYTHIRWVLRAPLAAGAKGFARFRAILR